MRFSGSLVYVGVCLECEGGLDGVEEFCNS